MADFQSGTFNIMPQTQAQWNADTRVAQSGTAVEIRTAKVEDRVDCDNVEFYVEIRIYP